MEHILWTQEQWRLRHPRDAARVVAHEVGGNGYTECRICGTSGEDLVAFPNCSPALAKYSFRISLKRLLQSTRADRATAALVRDAQGMSDPALRAFQVETALALSLLAELWGQLEGNVPVA